MAPEGGGVFLATFAFFFSYFASKTPETLAVRAGTARKRRRPYRTTFPNRETPYGTAGGVSWPYRTGFLPETEGGGGVSCNLLTIG
jgi:hypothetical protein